MAINEDESMWHIQCDECGDDDLSYDEHTFQSFFAKMKENGWRAFKKDGRWSHGCPKCVKGFGRAQG